MLKKKNKNASAGSKSGLSPPAGGAVQSKSSRRRAAKRNRAQGEGGNLMPFGYSIFSRNNPPRISGNGSSITIAHRELLGDVLSAINFRATSYPINPGLSTVFPWLSPIARQYESYTFHKLNVVYEPSCQTTTAGAVFLAIDFDALDDVPNTKAAMTAYSGGAKGMAYLPFGITAAKADLHKFSPERYVRDASIPNSDLKTYDCGQILVGYANAQADNVFTGEVYLEYTVELRTPHIIVHPEFENAARIESAASVTKTSPFTFPMKIGNLPVNVTDGTTLQFQKAGEYMMDLDVTGTGIVPGGLTLGGTCQSKKVGEDILANATATAGHAILQVIAAKNNETLTLTTPGFTTLSNVLLRIAPYAYSL
jgi:hypothetical protein